MWRAKAAIDHCQALREALLPVTTGLRCRQRPSRCGRHPRPILGACGVATGLRTADVCTALRVRIGEAGDQGKLGTGGSWGPGEAARETGRGGAELAPEAVPGSQRPLVAVGGVYADRGCPAGGPSESVCPGHRQPRPGAEPQAVLFWLEGLQNAVKIHYFLIHTGHHDKCIGLRRV